MRNHFTISYLAVGFQSVIRGLERNQLCCVIVSGDITPFFLLKVVLSHVQSSCIPAFIIPNLKGISKSTLGFATMVLGLKNDVADCPENKFYPIFRLVSQNPTIFDSPPISKPETFVSETDNGDIIQEPNKQPESTKNLYLYQEKQDERVFVPENAVNNHRITPVDKMQTSHDFISVEKRSQEFKNSIFGGNKGKHQCVDDSDDIDSDDENIFFTDTKPDESLLKIVNVQHQSSNGDTRNKYSKKKNKFLKGISKNSINALTGQHSGSTKKGTSEHKNKQNKNQNKNKFKKDKKNTKANTGVNFNPLKIKTFSNSINKSKKKKN